jgi:formylglycine-generating enzyme required for sulfatase activity
MKKIALKIIILIFSIGSFSSCSQKDITIKDNKIIVTLIPPNTVAINDTLYCDKTELANIDYREYQAWVLSVYGKDSEKYQSTIIHSEPTIYGFIDEMQTNSDTVFLKWFGHIHSYISFAESYFNHPSYDEYPVVGISYKQALDYTEWRSDRVYEMMLLKKGLIGIKSNINSENHFTIERYLNGQYYDYKPLRTVPIPRYRIPTIEEWELIAKSKGGNDWGIDFKNKEVQKYQSKSSVFFLTKDYLANPKYWEKKKSEVSKDILPYTSHVQSFFSYENKIFNLIGNVAEMTNTEGVAKGGSWCHFKEESKIKNNIHYTKPTLWLGVRNVCIWGILK